MANYLETEVLVIGCGIAGGVAALQLADSGIPITVITRTQEPQESNTYYAQGGIIYEGHDDSPELLAEDVIRAGAGQNNSRSVNILAKQGPTLVREILLDRVGVPFDQNGAGLSLAREGGHSIPRIIHAADATGKAISTALVEALQCHPNVTLLSGYTAVDLLMSDRHLDQTSARPPRCIGAYLLDQATGEVVPYVAKQTILATGGLGQVFWRTTNPLGARGDGVAMAHRAGAQIIDMEYVQFHPTTFYHPQAWAFLISEAVRGAGARLVDAAGEPFMQRYAPEWLDLAPRDIVSRSIHQEMMIRGVPNVYLDLATYIPPREIRRRFPNIYAQCLNFGVDLTRDLVPVSPAAHYACGGVAVDIWSQTTIKGLLAAGEVACTGLHGANRLASTSLLEGVVWGYRSAHYIQRHLSRSLLPRSAEIRPYPSVDLPLADSEQIDQLMQEIKCLMWQQVGLVRETTGLEQALARLETLRLTVDALVRRHRPTDHLSGLRNAVQVAQLITTAALHSEVGVGCHYRL
ncbi:MAG: L-aspartate oxidase [Anaerolineales bacterium]|nr:L-aspartate oxidase [Anaerolineales bacterium]